MDLGYVIDHSGCKNGGNLVLKHRLGFKKK
jgi:hypothetical protein